MFISNINQTRAITGRALESSTTILTIWIIGGYPFFLFRVPMHATQETLASTFTVFTKFLGLIVTRTSMRFPI